MKNYNKLVRDKIPEIIESNCQKCICRELGEEEYLLFLDKKLDEELAEYRTDGSAEELADILEVIKSIAESKGISWEELEKMRIAKAQARGSFNKHILLEKVF